ncbi:hypothetical protein KSP40_PGU002041 [Platanthera guangdongensis]|uniref:Uncharacterized protein n=1 Tax=Platanthera guangdongensis TaxID=2320717 RepID=A0ABR2MHN4_9ASPA
MPSNEVGALKELLQKNDNADRSLQNSACISPAIRIEDSGECLLEMKSLDTGKNAALSEKNTSLTLREDYNDNQLIRVKCFEAAKTTNVGRVSEEGKVDMVEAVLGVA